jgi:hypothetical protein
MSLPFNELLKKARETSLYPHHEDMAQALNLSGSGYRKMEDGSRLPSFQVVTDMMSHGFFPPKVSEELMEAWRRAKAVQAGIPTPAGPVDVHKTVDQLGRELLVVLRRYAPSAIQNHQQVAKTFKKRAEIILRTALET